MNRPPSSEGCGSDAVEALHPLHLLALRNLLGCGAQRHPLSRQALGQPGQ